MKLMIEGEEWTVFPQPMVQDFVYEKRTLAERLLTLPWRPFEKTKILSNGGLIYVNHEAKQMTVSVKMFDRIRKGKVTFS